MTDKKERNIVLSVTEYIGYSGPIKDAPPCGTSGYSGFSGILKTITTKEEFDAIVKQIKDEFDL